MPKLKPFSREALEAIAAKHDHPITPAVMSWLRKLDLATRRQIEAALAAKSRVPEGVTDSGQGVQAEWQETQQNRWFAKSILGTSPRMTFCCAFRFNQNRKDTS